MVDLHEITVNEFRAPLVRSRKDAHMNEQPTLLSRIGQWFRRDQPTNGDSAGGAGAGHETDAHQLMEPRTTFLRPWAKRDAAIQNLQEGFNTLTDLMGAIRDNLEKQNSRQDELVNAMQQLPQVLGSIP